jgi:membrane fusion protein, multidrug efflux system
MVCTLRRSKVSTAVSLAVLISIALIPIGCTSNSKTGNVRAAASPVVPVAVAPVQLKDLPIYLVGLGTVTPLNSVSVRSRVDGQLVRVDFREGQHVQKGQLLAVIDPRPFEVQLNQAEATLFRDQAQLRDANLNYERFKGLLQDSGAVSQQQVDTQKALVEQLEGSVRSDQATVNNAKLQITYCHITSPIDGRVGLRQVDPGNMVHAADTNPLVIITQLQPITTIFTLPQDQLPIVAQRLRNGQLPVEAFSKDDQTKIAVGRLQTIDNQIDPTTGTGRLKAQFSNEDNALWPNQFVNIHLQLEVRKNSILVPAAAVQRGPQGTFVFVVKPDKTVEVRPVNVALTESGITAITSGVSPNETVVTDGQDKLQAGSKVEPRAAGAPNRQPGAGRNPAQAAGNSPS